MNVYTNQTKPIQYHHLPKVKGSCFTNSTNLKEIYSNSIEDIIQQATIHTGVCILFIVYVLRQTTVMLFIIFS
ncbi:hypothetical protein QVD17_08023 [Tagetes erecta]|uniref:Uncharacterized protein n=1 Tax=Tagetes erecta TaxID=13708 RepID=A0AAD8KZ16_TARER|nr:hypothetical protein QVD17_08023 [Tagetes erecta]